jgi:hypothetical protein
LWCARRSLCNSSPPFPENALLPLRLSPEFRAPAARRPARSTRRNASKDKRDRGGSIAGQGTVVARLTNERNEAMLRETANSEILRLISTSPGDLDLVFSTILEHATRIFGTLFRFDGENLHPAAIDLTGTGLSY